MKDIENDLTYLRKVLYEKDKKIKSETAEREFWHSAYKEKVLTNDLLLKENQQLKQSQNNKVIEALNELKNCFALKDEELGAYDIIADYGYILAWIADKIIELRGKENENKARIK